MELIEKGPFTCGETPLWYSKESTLYWVDADTHLIHSWNRKKESSASFDTGLPVTAIRLDHKGQFILLSKWGLHQWKPDASGTEAAIVKSRTFLDNSETLRFNDGIPLADGDFIAGAFDESDLFNGKGALYRLNMDGKCELMDQELHVPNGIAVSPDQKTIYMSEMYKNRILAYTAADRNTVIKIPAEQGKPDGLLCDKEGNIWVAHWRGKRLSCYSSGGSLLRTVQTLCSSPTCFCFGDEEENSMYITSATLELDDQEISTFENQGGVFKIKL